VDITPIGNKVVVEIVDYDFGNGLVLPENAASGLTYCRVVAVGEGRILESGERIPVPVNVGDEVWFHPQGAIKLEPITAFGGRKLLAVEATAILCRVVRTPQDVADACKPKLVIGTPKKVKELVS
jgi:chaperonin GroES